MIIIICLAHTEKDAREHFGTTWIVDIAAEEKEFERSRCTYDLGLQPKGNAQSLCA
jgi:hypothetical protein